MLIGIPVFSQNPIQIVEESGTFSTGSQNAFHFTIANGDVKEVTKAWEKELKGWKGKVKGKEELFADDCKVKSMGDNTFDVYSKVEEVPGAGIRIWAAFDLGGAYLKSTDHPDKYLAAKKMLYDFALAQTKEVVKVEIKAAEKLQSEREAELAALLKSEQKLESDIKDYEKKIEEAKAEIATLQQSQTVKIAEVDAQKAVVTGLNDKLKAVK